MYILVRGTRFLGTKAFPNLCHDLVYSQSSFRPKFCEQDPRMQRPGSEGDIDTLSFPSKCRTHPGNT